MRAILLFWALSACTRSVEAIATHETHHREEAGEARATCRIEGTAESNGLEALFGARDGSESFARFNHRKLAISVHDVPTVLGARVGVRAATKSGFSLEGWLDRGRLQFSAKHRIPLARDVAWIPAGTELKVKVGDGVKVVVSLHPKSIEAVEALVPCDQLVVGRAPLEPSSEAGGDLFNLATDRLAVSATPGAPPVFTLLPKNHSSFAVQVEDVDGNMRLRFQDGIAVDGWVDRASLKPITSLGMSGIGCTGCGVAMRETLHGDDPVRSARVRRASSIHVGPAPSAPPRGNAAIGAAVVVLSELSGYARVVPRCYELVPETAFWISLADLDIDTRPLFPAATEC